MHRIPPFDYNLEGKQQYRTPAKKDAMITAGWYLKDNTRKKFGNRDTEFSVEHAHSQKEILAGPWFPFLITVGVSQVLLNAPVILAPVEFPQFYSTSRFHIYVLCYIPQFHYSRIPPI